MIHARLNDAQLRELASYLTVCLRDIDRLAWNQDGRVALAHRISERLRLVRAALDLEAQRQRTPRPAPLSPEEFSIYGY